MPTNGRKRGKVIAAENDKAAAEKARTDFESWYNDPSTRRLLPGDIDVDAALDRALGTRIESGFLNQGTAQYDHPA